MGPSISRVISVNVGRPRTVATRQGEATTAIWKTPVIGRVRASGVNLDGNVQVDRKNHGGPNKAIYAYAVEDIEHWKRHLGGQLGPGAMGENLTTVGIDPNEALIGERWAIGSTILEVWEPRSPLLPACAPAWGPDPAQGVRGRAAPRHLPAHHLGGRHRSR